MQIFIWERLNHVSKNYHEEGGIVAIAYDLMRARELIEETISTNHPCDALHTTPDYTFSCDAMEEQVIVFPDAGCC